MIFARGRSNLRQYVNDEEGKEINDCSRAADKIFCQYAVLQKYPNPKWLIYSTIYLKKNNTKLFASNISPGSKIIFLHVLISSHVHKTFF